MHAVAVAFCTNDLNSFAAFVLSFATLFEHNKIHCTNHEMQVANENK